MYLVFQVAYIMKHFKLMFDIQAIFFIIHSCLVRYSLVSCQFVLCPLPNTGKW